MSCISRLCCNICSVCCPSKPEPVEMGPVQLHESPGRKLHRAIEKSDALVVRYLLETRVDPTTVDEVTNEPPLEAAILSLSDDPDPEITKLLVDHGAVPSRDERLYIQAQLQESKTPPEAIYHLMTPLPDLYAPQIFYKGRFVSLLSFPGMSVTQAGFEAPIALFIVGQDAVGPDYGAVINSFDRNKNGKYAQMAAQFTVIRVLVDNKHRLVPLIDQIQELLPGLHLVYVSLDTHGSFKFIYLGKGDNGLITKGDGILFHEMTRRIHRLGTLAILGCRCAEGAENFVKWISGHVEERLVCGAPGFVYGDSIALIDSDIPYLPIILPSFALSQSESANPDITAVYHKGQLVWQGAISDSANNQALIDYCLAWSRTQAMRP